MVVSCLSTHAVAGAGTAARRRSHRKIFRKNLIESTTTARVTSVTVAAAGSTLERRRASSRSQSA